MHDYLIVGAGLFGAVFAHEATKRGKRCLVIDKRGHIGGNVHTEKVDDILVHRYGAHIFHTANERVWEYVNRFVRFNHYVNSPVAIYHDELYNLPFNMNTFSKLWGIKTPYEAKRIIAQQTAQEKIAAPRNLEEQVLSMVGRDIYEKLVKEYTEKQWGRPCTELPSFIIKRLPVRLTYDNNYFNDPHQGIPTDGYTALAEKLLEGSDIRLSTDYFDLRKSEKTLAKKTLFTGMIDAYFNFKLGYLEYRSLRFETEKLLCDNFQGNAVVNYTAKDVPYTRIIEHKHFNFGTQPATVITREYPSEWTPGEEPYYPINNDRNDALFAHYRALADQEEGVLFGGRLADYKYYDMDQVIASALALADKEFMA